MYVETDILILSFYRGVLPLGSGNREDLWDELGIIQALWNELLCLGMFSMSSDFLKCAIKEAEFQVPQDISPR